MGCKCPGLLRRVTMVGTKEIDVARRKGAWRLRTGLQYYANEVAAQDDMTCQAGSCCKQVVAAYMIYLVKQEAPTSNGLVMGLGDCCALASEHYCSGL